MYTLDFRDELIEHGFSYANRYVYNPNQALAFQLREEWDEELYITRALVDSRPVHPNTHLLYSTYAAQLANRNVTGAKLREIMDSARIPIIIEQGGPKYLVAKGFLARYYSSRRIKILMAACVLRGARVTSLSQVRYYVSRELYTEENKRVAMAVKETIDDHPGDVIITKDPMKYIGKVKPIIAAGSIRERKEAIENVFSRWMTPESPEPAP